MINNCRSCHSENLKEVLRLGNQYLSDFRDDDQKPPLHPLNLLYCGKCHLVQLTESTPSHEMYHDRYGFKSGINEAIKADLENIVHDALWWQPNPQYWLDIASNDGTLLSYVPESVFRVGIDPIVKYAEEARNHANTIISDFFDPSYFPQHPHGVFDVITSVSMFYDLDDPNKFVEGVKDVLAEDGIWVIQQNYLLTMLEINAYDNICHEHLTYFSLHSLVPLLGRHGLEINSVSLSNINGGCIRTVVSRRGSHPVSATVGHHLANEIQAGLNGIDAYQKFEERVQRSIRETRDFVKEVNAQGKTVFIYGASTRGGTIWQAAGLDVKDLPYAVERNPDKFSKVISSIGTPIISEEDARKMKPEFMLVSPWFFRDVFIEREKEYLESGGHLVFPLPEFEII